jgi:uncharacterized protein (DUF2062 family)
MRFIPATAKHNLILWLSKGISPQRLALTLALGFAIGCIPMVGAPTVLCAVLAVVLRLNLPVIQAANFAAIPFQVALFFPLARLGRWLVAIGPAQKLATHAFAHLSQIPLAARISGLAGQALLAWLLAVIPAVALITWVLTRMLRRIPAAVEAE